MLRTTLALATAFILATAACAADIAFENRRVRVVLGDDAVWRSIVAKDTGRNLCPKAAKVPFATARVAGKTHQANRATLDGDRLTVGFKGADTVLVYRVTTRPDWLEFRLEQVKGTRPTHLDLVQVGVTPQEHLGSRLNCSWDEKQSICLMALNLQSDGKAHRGKSVVWLRVRTQDAPGPRLEGAGAALVAAPTNLLHPILRQISLAHGLPRNEDANGTPSKDLPLARQSYWFLTFGESEVDKVIACCKKMGFRQVMMGSGSWCRTVGHYTFHRNRYPDGIESLKRTVAKLHAAGILVGMHCFASKVSKTDSYVTPVPDRRFWVVDSAKLAADIGATDAAIRLKADLRQWPGSPVCKQKTWEGGVAKHREVVIDDEIVAYESIGPEGKWDTLLGCHRGAWGTKAAAHRTGTASRRYGVDGCINGYIIDQETDLIEETTDRLAHVFNTCGFDMVYFDGGEDVDRRRFTHYVSKFQALAMSKFTKRPLVHMGTIMTHGLWHSFTRSATVDHYLNTVRGRIIAGGRWAKLPTVKDHIDRSVRYMQSVGEDRMPGELGWFGIWAKRMLTLPGNGGGRRVAIDGLQFDEIEYLMCKSLAYNAPISLQTSFASMESHPLTPGILELIKAYEEIRLSSRADEATRRKLRELGKDFLLLRLGEGVQFVEVARVAEVAGGNAVRAFVGEAGGHTVASVWHAYGRDGTLVLRTGDRRPAITLLGDPAQEGSTALPVGARRALVAFVGETPATVSKWLREATFEVRPPATIWLQAEDAARMVGKMAKGSAVGVKEDGAFGDVVLCTAPFNRTKPQPWYAEYRVKVPHKGRWTLWARVRYPHGGDLSFGLVRPGEAVTLSGNQVIGNCGVNAKQWHWTGRGGGSTHEPPGQPITFTLDAGEFVFRIT
ncbi:hypothetical protein HQ576_03830, partial [bacterium]|nr:hypothetical protein [bacterium]